MQNSSLFFTLLLFTLWTSPLHSQNIKELFIDFPGPIFNKTYPQESKKAFLSSTEIGERGELRQTDQFEESNEYHLAILDIAGGFMRIDNFEFQADMCVWRKTDGHKLVALCETVTASYVESEIAFYDYYQGNWKALNTDSIMPHSQYRDLLDIRATLAANQGKAIPLDRVAHETEIHLPQKGKDILVELGLVDFSDEAGKGITYKLIYKSENISYFWNDGIFLKE